MRFFFSASGLAVYSAETTDCVEARRVIFWGGSIVVFVYIARPSEALY